MAYEKQTWINRDATKPANATRLNHIEDGIYNAYNVSLIAITNIEPSEYNEGDKYFNTSDNLIYTATGSNEWSETGETPISDKTYVLLEDGSTYMYDGTTLTRIGGSEQEVENEYSESTELPYSCDYVNGEILDIYSTSETKTKKKWIDNKPIYRKVFTGSSIQTVNTGLTEIDDIVKMEMLIRINDATKPWRNIPWLFNSGTATSWMGGFYLRADTGQIVFQMGSELTNIDRYIIILEYTKTTV